MAQIRVPNSLILLGLLMMLVLHPLEAVAGERMHRCAKLLRSAGQRVGFRARIAMIGLGGGAALAGGGVYVAPLVSNYLDHSAAKVLQADSKAGRVGATYALNWVSLGEMTPTEGAKLVESFDGTVRERLLPVRERIEQFRRLMLWSPAEAALARTALERVQALRWSGATFTTANVQYELTADPLFKKVLDALPERAKFTVTLLTEPTVVVDGRPDADWLTIFFDHSRYDGIYSDDQLAALENLRKLYDLHDPTLSLPTLTKMVADSMADTEGIRAKIERAKALKINEPIIYRSDLPMFAHRVIYRSDDGIEILEGEIDRWRLIRDDPAFATIREQRQAGRISDIKALTEAENLIVAHQGTFASQDIQKD